MQGVAFFKKLDEALLRISLPFLGGQPSPAGSPQRCRPQWSAADLPDPGPEAERGLSLRIMLWNGMLTKPPEAVEWFPRGMALLLVGKLQFGRAPLARETSSLLRCLPSQVEELSANVLEMRRHAVEFW